MSLFARRERDNPHDKEHADLYLAEARGRLERMRVRSASLDTRAGLLISSTAIAAALQSEAGGAARVPELGGAITIAALCAILMGVLVLVAGKGPELDDQTLRKRIQSSENEPFLDSFWVADKHFEHARAGEATAVRKAKRLNWGFLALAVAVTLSLIA